MVVMCFYVRNLFSYSSLISNCYFFFCNFANLVTDFNNLKSYDLYQLVENITILPWKKQLQKNVSIFFFLSIKYVYWSFLCIYITGREDSNEVILIFYLIGSFFPY